ncbi:MAG: hypothetical protein KQI78_25095 [Deltaproteobacteria bacterium]|nr:hypothetical protein [Deltaproteobacteria bacterium]
MNQLPEVFGQYRRKGRNQRNEVASEALAIFKFIATQKEQSLTIPEIKAKIAASGFIQPVEQVAEPLLTPSPAPSMAQELAEERERSRAAEETAHREKMAHLDTKQELQEMRQRLSAYENTVLLLSEGRTKDFDEYRQLSESEKARQREHEIKEEVLFEEYQQSGWLRRGKKAKKLVKRLKEMREKETSDQTPVVETAEVVD